MDKLDALALADDMRASYPGKGVGDRHVQHWAREFELLGDREARRVVDMVTARSTEPPSRGQLLQALGEVRQRTMSPRIDPSLCVYVDGVECRNCGSVHGHPLDPGQTMHGMYHLGLHRDGEDGHFEAALHPEQCSCDFVPPEDIDVERVIGILAGWVVLPYGEKFKQQRELDRADKQVASELSAREHHA